jgi:hemolysin activation/secretion protein
LANSYPRMNGAGRSLAALACAVAAAGAAAQVPLPPSTDPGRIEERAAPQRKPAPRRELPEIRTPAPAALPDALKAVRVTLKEIRIEGSAVLPIAEPQALANRYVGREITGSEIFELARALTALYRNAGYILSQVVVPPQTLSDGKLTLRVIEGHIATVRIEADPYVARTLAELGEKIKASRPLHADVLERYLLIANDLPGVRVRAVLAPSQTVGAADLALIATVKSADGFLSLDNYGSKYLGPGQLSVGAGINQLFGVNDQLRFAGVTTGNSELSYGQLSYSQVVSSEGLKLGASASIARTKPGDVLEPADVRGRADTITLSAGYPVLRTRNQSLLGRALFDYRNINTDILGTRLIEDKIRALRLGLTWLAVDRLDGNNAVDFELSAGLGGTKQSDLLKSRAGADGRFRKITFDYERFQRVGDSFGLTVGAGGQWTDQPLLSSEQFALGGRRFGRAYEPAELTGDRVLAFRAEPAYLGRTGSRWLGSYHLYGFYDVGKVWYNDAAPAANRPAQSLASAGFGTRVFSDDKITATLELAKPLTREIASYQADGKGRRARILGSVVVRF